MDKNSTPNGSQEQGKKSGNEGLQEKGQAGSEALSLLKNPQLKESLRLFQMHIESMSEEDFKKAIEEIGDVGTNGPTVEEYMDYINLFGYRLPEVSGFRMARLVCLALILSSCSFNLSPTTAQREQKKFERFKIAPKEALIYSGTAFLSYGVGKHFADLKLKD